MFCSLFAYGFSREKYPLLFKVYLVNLFMCDSPLNKLDLIIQSNL